MFPDSDITRVFKCGRTKATATVKVIAQDMIEESATPTFFSIQIDESTDITSQTRWLSLEACVNRLLKQYEALFYTFGAQKNRLLLLG